MPIGTGMTQQAQHAPAYLVLHTGTVADDLAILVKRLLAVRSRAELVVYGVRVGGVQWTSGRWERWWVDRAGEN